MKAKEKAKELLEKYQSEKVITYQRSSSSPIEEYELSDSEAKFCIKILIDEIIKNNEELGKKMFYELGTDSYSSRCLNQDNYFFWLEVKSEIEKL